MTVAFVAITACDNTGLALARLRRRDHGFETAPPIIDLRLPVDSLEARDTKTRPLAVSKQTDLHNIYLCASSWGI